MDKFNEMTLGEKLAAGGGLLMLIASILPWYKVSFEITGIVSSSVSRNGWQSPGAIWSVLAVLISVGFASLVVARNLAT